MTVSLHHTGNPCSISPFEVSTMMLRALRNKPRTTWKKLLNGVQKAEATLSNDMIGNPLCITCEFHLLKSEHIQSNRKFASEHLDDPERYQEKVMWSGETKTELIGLKSIRPVWKDECHSMNTIPTAMHGA